MEQAVHHKGPWTQQTAAQLPHKPPTVTQQPSSCEREQSPDEGVNFLVSLRPGGVLFWLWNWHTNTHELKPLVLRFTALIVYFQLSLISCKLAGGHRLSPPLPTYKSTLSKGGRERGSQQRKSPILGFSCAKKKKKTHACILKYKYNRELVQFQVPGNALAPGQTHESQQRPADFLWVTFIPFIVAAFTWRKSFWI